MKKKKILSAGASPNSLIPGEEPNESIVPALVLPPSILEKLGPLVIQGQSSDSASASDTSSSNGENSAKPFYPQSNRIPTLELPPRASSGVAYPSSKGDSSSPSAVTNPSISADISFGGGNSPNTMSDASLITSSTSVSPAHGPEKTPPRSPNVGPTFFAPGEGSASPTLSAATLKSKDPTYLLNLESDLRTHLEENRLKDTERTLLLKKAFNRAVTEKNLHPQDKHANDSQKQQRNFELLLSYALLSSDNEEIHILPWDNIKPTSLSTISEIILTARNKLDETMLKLQDDLKVILEGKSEIITKALKENGLSISQKKENSFPDSFSDHKNKANLKVVWKFCNLTNTSSNDFLLNRCILGLQGLIPAHEVLICMQTLFHDFSPFQRINSIFILHKMIVQDIEFQLCRDDKFETALDDFFVEVQKNLSGGIRRVIGSLQSQIKDIYTLRFKHDHHPIVRNYATLSEWCTTVMAQHQPSFESLLNEALTAKKERRKEIINTIIHELPMITSYFNLTIKTWEFYYPGWITKDEETIEEKEKRKARSPNIVLQKKYMQSLENFLIAFVVSEPKLFTSALQLIAEITARLIPKGNEFSPDLGILMILNGVFESTCKIDSIDFQKLPKTTQGTISNLDNMFQWRNALKKCKELSVGSFVSIPFMAYFLATFEQSSVNSDRDLLDTAAVWGKIIEKFLFLKASLKELLQERPIEFYTDIFHLLGNYQGPKPEYVLILDDTSSVAQLIGKLQTLGYPNKGIPAVRFNSDNKNPVDFPETISFWFIKTVSEDIEFKYDKQNNLTNILIKHENTASMNLDCKEPKKSLNERQIKNIEKLANDYLKQLKELHAILNKMERLLREAHTDYIHEANYKNDLAKLEKDLLFLANPEVKYQDKESKTKSLSPSRSRSKFFESDGTRDSITSESDLPEENTDKDKDLASTKIPRARSFSSTGKSDSRSKLTSKNK